MLIRISKIQKIIIQTLHQSKQEIYKKYALKTNFYYVFVANKSLFVLSSPPFSKGLFLLTPQPFTLHQFFSDSKDNDIRDQKLFLFFFSVTKTNPFQPSSEVVYYCYKDINDDNTVILMSRAFVSCRGQKNDCEINISTCLVKNFDMR